MKNSIVGETKERLFYLFQKKPTAVLNTFLFIVQKYISFEWA